MDNRIKLHERLKEVAGVENIYFQPPASVKIQYPCIVYNIGNGDAKYADNSLYIYKHKYEVIYISKKSNIDIIETMLRNFEMCSLSRSYISDNLYHYAFDIFF